MINTKPVTRSFFQVANMVELSAWANREFPVRRVRGLGFCPFYNELNPTVQGQAYHPLNLNA